MSDIHGCYKEFIRLLEKAEFNCKKDYLWIAGDLVSRGIDSLKVLRYLYNLKNRVKIVLGNHDLNLISVYSGIKKNNKNNHFDKFLAASDSHKLIRWLRSQKILKIDKKRKIVMTHAGISPHWNLNIAQKYAIDIERFLSSDNFDLFLESMYDNKVTMWHSDLNGLDRLRYSMNVFTRMRSCYPDGRLNLFYKQSPKMLKPPLKPWFFMKHNFPQDYYIFFGHWSTLRGTAVPQPFFSLDSGCCWGGELMMFRWEDKKIFSQKFFSQE